MKPYRATRPVDTECTGGLQRRGLLRTSLALAAAAGAAAPRASSATRIPINMRTTEFLDTLGINTHAAYTDGQYGDVGAALDALRFLGLRHLRAAPPPLRIDATWRGHIHVAAHAGLQFNFVADARRAPHEMIDIARGFALKHPGLAFSLEGPNEVNSWPVRFEGQRGDAAAVAYQSALFRLAKATPELRDTVMLSAIGMLVASDGDWANFHAYSWRARNPLPPLSES